MILPIGQASIGTYANMTNAITCAFLCVCMSFDTCACDYNAYILNWKAHDSAYVIHGMEHYWDGICTDITSPQPRKAITHYFLVSKNRVVFFRRLSVKQIGKSTIIWNCSFIDGKCDDFNDIVVLCLGWWFSDSLNCLKWINVRCKCIWDVLMIS